MSAAAAKFGSIPRKETRLVNAALQREVAETCPTNSSMGCGMFVPLRNESSLRICERGELLVLVCLPAAFQRR